MTEIGRMEERDVEAVALLEQACFSEPWSRNAFAEALHDSNKYFIVARMDGIVCGYCGVSYVLDEGEITNVAVDPGARQQGIGRQILEAVFREGTALGIERYFLEVRESNAPAQALYRTCGFQTDGIRKNFYAKPAEHAVLMSRTADGNGE